MSFCIIVSHEWAFSQSQDIDWGGTIVFWAGSVLFADQYVTTNYTAIHSVKVLSFNQPCVGTVLLNHIQCDHDSTRSLEINQIEDYVKDKLTPILVMAVDGRK